MAYEDNKLHPGEPPDCYSKDKTDRARETIAFTIRESSTHYDSLRRNFDDWYDRYTNMPLKLRQTNRIRSNVPSGIVPEMIDSVRADMMDKITKRRPYVPAIAREPQDFDSARLIEALNQFDFDQMRSFQIIDAVLLSTLMWGSGLAKIMFETRTAQVPLKGILGADGKPQMEEVITYQGPIIVPAFIYDVFPHPQKTHPDDPFPIVHITYESYDDLLALAEAGIYEMAQVKKIPDRQFYNANDDMATYAPFDTDDLTEKFDQRARLGWSTDTRMDPDGIMVCECECMFRHKDNEPPVRTIITIANGVVIRIAPSPLRDGSSVWLNAKIMNVPGQFYGQSLIQKNKPQVHVAEVTLNMGLQNLAVAVNRMKVVRPDLIMNAQSLDDTPGGNIFAKPNAGDINNIVKPLDPVSVAQDVFAFMNWGQARAEGVSANTELKSGRMPTGERTATASNLAFTQASVRFKYMLSWFGETFLLPANEKMLAYNRDYLTEQFVFKIVGKQGVHWKAVTQNDLGINVDFVFLGPNREENEALQIAQLENMLKIVTPLASFGWAQPLIQEIVVLLADKFDFPDMERLKELIGYGQQPPTLGPLQPQTQTGGMPAGPSSGPGGRQDRRLGSGGPPVNMQQIAKSLGGLMGRGGGGVRA